jgi:hypothetical protein
MQSSLLHFCPVALFQAPRLSKSFAVIMFLGKVVWSNCVSDAILTTIKSAQAKTRSVKKVQGS